MKNPEGKKIRIMRDGPYEVSGNVPLDRASLGCNEDGNAVSWEKEEKYESGRETYRLCRCGRTNGDPYCDGSHKQTGFHGREQPDNHTYRERAERVRGEAVDLLDDESLCVGARFCDVGSSVWGYVERSGDPANRAMAVEEACNCPAGRLTVLDSDGRAIEPELPQEISAVDDPVRDCRGPLWVKGGIEMEGEKYETRNRVTLCRCGESKNQPYCDGSHYGCEHMQGL